MNPFALDHVGNSPSWKTSSPEPRRLSTVTGVVPVWVLGGLACLLFMTGCMMSREPSNWMEQRTGIEQLLFNQALTDALDQITLPLPEEASVALEVVAPSPPLYQNMLRDRMATRLGELGFRVRKDLKDATYLVRVTAGTLGTEQGSDLIGIPALASGLLPVGTPEIALFKEQYNHGMVRVMYEVVEIGSGTQILTSRWYDGRRYFNQYVFFLVFGTQFTDLAIP